MLNRERMSAALEDRGMVWDFIIIGGGATGVGVAIDAASRGYKTLLLEAHDFGKGTSSRSTKLVHGGVRYLQQGNVSLVLDALKERGLMRQNAPHLVHDLAFIVPNYSWWEAPFYGIGLRVYDFLAGKHGFGPSRNLSREKTQELIPTIETEGLRGGVIYYDGQFDDTRLLINMAQTAETHGATLLNYVEVTQLIKENELVRGVIAVDRETGAEYKLKGRVVVSATGAFTDAIRRMDNPENDSIISPSQGVHIILDKSFLPGDTAVLVPHTSDGRVLFAIPWHGHTLVGTTDTPIDAVSLEPRALQEELDFLLSHTARYLSKDPADSDVLSLFTGIRPLVAVQGESKTASLSRDHTLHISGSGLVTITGGKWTTYRKMAEDTVDQAATVAELDSVPCVTRDLPIHGATKEEHAAANLALYGSDAGSVESLLRENNVWTALLHPQLDIQAGEVIWSVREEMARTVEDFLGRRSRALFLNARAAVEMAPRVAALMAAELGKNPEWQEEQIRQVTDLAEQFFMMRK
ncbi:MAG TPA: glycerol-3-phosphate dehydrogenase/oxidase [Candidatus Hydrogenedentes bacterium]|nr:glycerol-3-phosphate dehydrogenase/oxidase [Candidatus Hydrogenedentota bacterium]